MAPHEPGLWQEVIHGIGKIVEPILRPLNVVSCAISDRLDHLLSRKPKLYVTIHPQTPVWCLAFNGNETGMQLSFVADFVHDDLNCTVLLTGTYIKGTKPWYGFINPIEIPPQQMIKPQHTTHAIVHPVVGKVGEAWKGRLIFVDQFHRTYPTEKIEFKFVGPTENPLKPKG